LAVSFLSRAFSPVNSAAQCGTALMRMRRRRKPPLLISSAAKLFGPAAAFAPCFPLFG
jgi:hypothetical protein